MKKPSNVFAALALSAVMVCGFAACTPQEPNPDKPGPDKPGPNPPASYVDETMGGSGVLDHIFEAEAAEFSGVSSTGNSVDDYGNHACAPASYAVNEGFSGGICLRSVSSPAGTAPNTFTFRFRSDKKVRCIMAITVSSTQGGGSTFLANSYLISVNGTAVENSVLIPAKTDGQSPVSGSDVNGVYFYMQTVELEIKLEEGDNTVVFEAGAGVQGANQFDCINIKTSADLTGFVPHYWDSFLENAAVTEAPTQFTAGKLSLADDHSVRTFDLPELTSSLYTTEKEGETTKYYFAGTGLLIAEVNEGEQIEDEPVDETQDPAAVGNRFEAETAAFKGQSYGNTKQSTRSSYAVGDGFSGGICLKNVASNSDTAINSYSFVIESDKAVIAKMDIRVASLGAGSEDSVFSDHLTLTVNNETVDTDGITVLSKEGDGVEKAGSDFFWMQTVTVPVTLHKGVNKVMFEAAVGQNNAYNFDYIEIFTTATLTFTPQYWDLTGITVATAPTMENTGIINVKDSSTGQLTETYTLPALTSDIYTTAEEDDLTVYYLGNTGIRITDSAALETPPAAVKLGPVGAGSSGYESGKTGKLGRDASSKIGEEDCTVWNFYGKTGEKFRLLTGYTVQSAKSYKITYTVKNFGEVKLHLQMYQVPGQWSENAITHTIELEQDAEETFSLEFSGFADNSNLIALFKLLSDVEETAKAKFGIYAYIEEL